MTEPFIIKIIVYTHSHESGPFTSLTMFNLLSFQLIEDTVSHCDIACLHVHAIEGLFILKLYTICLENKTVELLGVNFSSRASCRRKSIGGQTACRG